MNRPRWLLWLSFALVPSCVQVLGLEQASLDERNPDTAAKSTVASPRSRLSCDEHPGAGCPCEEAPTPDCTACLQRECPSVELDCVSDSDCRAALDAYGVCLGRGCGGDDEQEACTTNLSEQPLLKECVASCHVECRQTKLVSPCELYCACMNDFCSKELADAAIADCVKTCESWDADVRDCRRDHCEYGQGAHNHCLHASPGTDVCASEADLSADERSVCLDKSESTWACEEGDECCSSECNDGVCR